MFQQVPPPCLIVRAQEQDGLGTGATPEYARPFQTQVDDAAHGTFDGTTPDRQLHGHPLCIGHATLMLSKVVMMRADRPAVTPSADHPHRRNDLLHLALQQQVALLGAPPRACFRTPVIDKESWFQ